MEKYVKVTIKGREPFVVTERNSQFYKKQMGARLDDATEEEILRYFPHEKKSETKTKKSTAKEL